MVYIVPAKPDEASKIYDAYPFFDPSKGSDVLGDKDAETGFLPTVLMSGSGSRGWAPTLKSFTSKVEALPKETMEDHLSAGEYSALDVLLKATEDASKEMTTLVEKRHELTGSVRYPGIFAESVSRIRTLLDQSQAETERSAGPKKSLSFTGIIKKLKSGFGSAEREVQQPEGSEIHTGGMSTAKLRQELLVQCQEAQRQGDRDTQALFEFRTKIRTQNRHVSGSEVVSGAGEVLTFGND